MRDAAYHENDEAKHFQQLIDPVRHENLSGQDGFEAENTEGRKTCLPE